MQDPLAEQGNPSLSLHVPFHELALRHLSLDLAVIHPPGETSLYCRFLSFDAPGNLLEFGEIPFAHLCSPTLQAMPFSFAQQQQDILNQAIRFVQHSPRPSARPLNPPARSRQEHPDHVGKAKLPCSLNPAAGDGMEEKPPFLFG